MINRILVKDAVVFDKVEIEPVKGLNIFSGPSGAGKSVFVSQVLSVFGFNEPNASLAEISISNLKSDEVELEDENIIREVKKDKVRYFLNDSQIGKGALKDLLYKSVRFLNLKDTQDIENESLLELLDLSVKGKSHNKLLKSFKKNYEQYKILEADLKKLKDAQKNLEEKKEFALYEIDKIKSVNPKEGEYEELLDLKKTLSKKEKITEAINEANGIFDLENSVVEALNLASEDSDSFTETMNELRAVFENKLEQLEELNNINADELLDRIEKVSSLVKRYGSEQEALEYLKEKEAELETFDNIDEEVLNKEKEYEEILKVVTDEATEISKGRNEAKEGLEKLVNEFLEKLRLSTAQFQLASTDLYALGMDEVSIELKGVNLNKISSGEFNRLRLALLAGRISLNKDTKGILFLDEIDANVSGEESQAIANVVKLLSKNYQIFAISHQPQLSSVSDNHYLIEKKDGGSWVKKLDFDGKAKEIARMISGDKITDDAFNHAKKLLGE
ncbi:MAG: DNA recombination protein RecN [Campylobacterales bacterium]|nr:DNA recombination protein RecN [Campylobacterales bacterium]